MGNEHQRAAIAIPNTLVQYHPDLFRGALPSSFTEDEIIECRMAEHSDKSPISIVGSADRALMFGLYEGDNWRQSFSELCVLADAFTAIDPNIGSNVNQLGIFLIDTEGRRDRLDEKLVSDSLHRAVVKGQGIPIRALIRSLKANGVDFICGINEHSNRIHTIYEAAGILHIPLSTEGVFLDHIIHNGILTEKQLSNLVLGTTDIGGLKELSSAKQYLSQRYGIQAPIAVINKYHIPTGVDFMSEKHSEFAFGDVQGKFVLIIDDRTDSGSSIEQAMNIYLEKGADQVGAYITHPVFADERYFNTCKRMLANPRMSFLFVSNSLPMGLDRISRPGGVNIPFVRVGEPGKKVKKSLQVLDIHPFIVQCAKTILACETIQDAYNQFENEKRLLDMRSPYLIFEEVSGIKLPQPTIVGVYDSGEIYPFPSET